MFLMLFVVLGLNGVIKLVNYVWFDLLQNSPILMVLAALAAIGVLVLVIKIKRR
jgi:uncharacterized membrane protein YadS